MESEFHGERPLWCEAKVLLHVRTTICSRSLTDRFCNTSMDLQESPFLPLMMPWDTPRSVPIDCGDYPGLTLFHPNSSISSLIIRTISA